MKIVAIESFDPILHRNHMPELPAPASPQKVLVVVVGKFRLEFLSRAQFDAAMAYFASPSGTTRMTAMGGEHWEFQPWRSRLPAGINNRHNRPRVLAVLTSAKELAQAQLP
jgi:hypothetical protein